MQGFVQYLDPMPHRRGRAALQVADTADVGRHNGLGLSLAQVAELAVTQGGGDLRLQDW